MTASLNTALSLAIAAWIGLDFDMTVRPVIVGYAVFGAVALGLMLLSEMYTPGRPRGPDCGTGAVSQAGTNATL